MPNANFDSDFDTDKILSEGTISIVNSGATTQAPQTAHIVSNTVANPHQRQTFVRARWSVDGGTSWQGLSTKLVYIFTINFVAPLPVFSAELNGLQAAISIGVSGSSVHFVTANGYHGTVSDNGTTYTYTPISQTFLIEYTLFEMT